MKKPEPKALVTLSVEDIYEHSKQIGNRVTMKQAIEIFDNIDSSDWDCENSTFWAFIEWEIEKYKDGIE